MSGPVDLSVATRVSSADTVEKLIDEVNAIRPDLKDGGEAARHAMLGKVRTLLQTLQTPREQMVLHTWANVGHPPKNTGP